MVVDDLSRALLNGNVYCSYDFLVRLSFFGKPRQQVRCNFGESKRALGDGLGFSEVQRQRINFSSLLKSFEEVIAFSLELRSILT